MHSYEDKRKESKAQLRSHPPTGPPYQAENRHAKQKNIITWLFDPESFTPMAKLIDGHSCAILTDHLGTPLGMADAMGNLVWSADISPEGQVRMLAGDRHACPFRFPGQYEDAETGLYYNRFRYYDPESATYLSPDPIGFAGGTALYAYVRDPLTWVDPLGLKPCTKPGDTGATSEGLPQLKGTTNKELVGEALDLLKKPGTQKEKADLFDALVPEIDRRGGGFTSARSKGTEGSEIFLGERGEALIITPEGKVFRGSVNEGGVVFGKDFKPTPMFDKLRLIE